MAQYAIQKVMKVRTYDIVTDEPKVNLSFLKETTFTNGQESVALTQDGTPITHFDHSKTLAVTGSAATIDDGLLELQTGSDITVLTNTTEIRISEVLTVASNKVTTTYTPTGTAGAQLKFVEILDAYGNETGTFEQAATPTAGKFSVSAKVVTFFSGELTNGTKVRVHYYPTAASARKISQLANTGSATVRAELECVFKDACTSTEVLGLIVIPKAHIMGNFEWSLTEAGEPAIHNFSIEAQKSCLDEKLWDWYVYESSDLT